MKHFSFIIALTIFGFSATAQQWTSQQKELIQHIQTCIDIWQGKDFDRWFSVCHPDSSLVIWNTNEGSTGYLTSSRKGLEATVKSSLEYVNMELRPLAILIDRDIAIAYYYIVRNMMDNGQRITQEQKRMEVFRKVAGRWILLSGMYTPTLPK